MMSTYALWRPNGVSGSLVCDQVTANVVDGGGAESAFLVVGQYVSWVARVSDLASTSASPVAVYNDVTYTLLDHGVCTGRPLHEHRRVPRLHRHLQPRRRRAERLQRFGRPGMQAMLAVLFPGRDQRLSPVPAVLTRLCRRSVDRGQLQPSRTRRRSTVVRIVRSGHVRCW